jgi:hypothetical protein
VVLNVKKRNKNKCHQGVSVRRRPVLYLNISSLRTRGKIWRELKLYKTHVICSMSINFAVADLLHVLSDDFNRGFLSVQLKGHFMQGPNEMFAYTFYAFRKI